jgi:hypothetical protein
MSDYDEGFKAGYLRGWKSGDLYSWFKLFCLVILACFAAHFIWALIPTLV